MMSMFRVILNERGIAWLTVLLITQASCHHHHDQVFLADDHPPGASVTKTVETRKQERMFVTTLTDISGKVGISREKIESAIRIFTEAQSTFSPTETGFSVFHDKDTIEFKQSTAESLDVSRVGSEFSNELLDIFQIATKSKARNLVLKEKEKIISYSLSGVYGSTKVLVFAKPSEKSPATLAAVGVWTNDSLVMIGSGEKSGDNPDLLVYFSQNVDVLDGRVIEIRRNGDEYFLSKNGFFNFGVQNGSWEEYHPNQKIKSKSTYVKGKRTGDYLSYYENGTVESRTSYISDEIDGLSVHYYENGKPQEIRNYKNGIPIGTWISYASNGSKASETPYRAGKIEGTVINYESDGTKVSETPYRAGKIEGTVINYESDGTKVSETPYRAGEIDGLMKTFIGTSILEKTYRKGVEIGPKVFRNALTGKKFFEYSETKMVFNLQGGRQVTLTYSVGRDKSFDPNTGRLTRTESIISTPTLLSDGTIGFIKTNTNYAPTGKVTEIYSNICWVVIKDDSDYYRTGLTGEKCELHGTAKKYLSNGRLEYVENYELGKSVGEQRYFWPNGKLKSSSNFNGDGNLDGVFEAYFDNGKIKERTVYVNGKTQGESVRYYPSGKVAKKGVLEPGDKPDESLWVEFIEYYESGRPKKQCDFRSSACVQWDLNGKRFDLAH